MINFNTIKPFNNISFGNLKKEPKIPNTGLTSDVFIRTSKSEENSTNSFINWAKETDFVQSTLPQILQNPDNILGKGFSHTTYIIPENNDYILRSSNNENFEKIDYSKTKIIDKEDKNLKINIGQKVADIELSTDDNNEIPRRIEVLKKQNGKSVGVPPSQVLYDENTGKLRDGEIEYENYSRKEKYAQSLNSLAKLPVEAFEKLISDVTEASEAGYSFDYLNSNNLLVDEENQAINLIDMDKSKMGVSYGNVLYALTNIDYFDTYTSRYLNPVSNEEIQNAIMNTMNITQKYIQAMKNQNVKFDKYNQSIEFNSFVGSLPMSYLCKTMDTDKKWEYFEQQGVA